MKGEIMNAAIKSEIVYFKLGENFGERVTDIAREKAWDDGHRAEAILFLTDSLVGFTTELAKEIIDGKKKLITDGQEVNLVDDDWEAPDLDKMKRFINDVLVKGQNLKGPYFERSTFARPSFEDTFLADCGKLREWKKENIIKAYREARLLNKTYELFMLDRAKWATAVATHAKTSINESVLSAGITEDVFSRIALSDLPEEQKRRLLSVAGGIMEALESGVKIIINDYAFDTGWLDRDGNFYGCKPGQHIHLAGELLQKLFPDKAPEIDLAERILEKEGWAKCTDGEWYYDSPTRLTVKMIASLKKWCALNGYAVKWNFEDRTVEDIARRGR